MGGEFALLHVHGKCVTKLSCSICLLSLHISNIEDARIDIFTTILRCWSVNKQISIAIGIPLNPRYFIDILTAIIVCSPC